MTDVTLTDAIRDFAAQTIEEAARAFRAFRDTGTITAFGTVGFIERVPGEPVVVSVNYHGPFEPEKELTADIFTLDGTVLQGKGLGATRFLSIFNAHPDITSLSHVHTPNLGAWSQTHRSLPFTYVPVQRFQLARELPIYIDRRQDEDQFILEVLNKNPRTPAILEANGGATAWGWDGLRKLAEFILLLEEGADIAIRAEAIGGSRDFGPGVLRQQWKMSRLFDAALQEGLLPVTDRY
jgi:ribulose-5-phosphate 4-epimerase/fuculose-1-phosphate aldolase